MAAPSQPPLPPASLVDPVLEVRFAIVLYGGVSLAIYINGVAQELLSLARATAPGRRPAAEPVPPLVADGELRGAEPVYRELGRRLHLREEPGAPDGDPRWSRVLTADDPIGTTFVVDVLSGTSAGGINGVFLAKALANQQTLDDLRKLWISEGDIDLLLHDGASKKAMPAGYHLPKEPASLLNSQRMYRKLQEALNGLDESNPEGGQRPSPFVDELDLYVTSTDLDGVVLPVQLADREIFERRHRNVFHFLYAKAETTGDARNDFVSLNNRFLAFAARCTSSFPFAFEPMQLGDIRVFERGGDAAFNEDLGRWSVFFRDYLKASEVAGRIPDAASSDFPRRSFGDGGYLDNKPFGYAIDALRWRRSSGRVVRKLIYVEPSPDHPERDAGAHVRPDAVENLMAAASTIPRSETIREDVMRVRERNALIQRINRATRTIESDVIKGFSLRDLPQWSSTAAWLAEGLQEMSAAYGPGFASYHRLKVAEVTSDLAELVTRVAGLDEDSQEFVAIRYLVSAWRQKYYSPEKRKQRDDTRATENDLLLNFDLAYRLRRIAFVDSRIDALLAFDDYAHEALKAEYEGRASDLDAVWRDPEWRRRLEAELRRIKRELGVQFVRLRRRGRQLRARGNSSELREAIVKLAITREEFAEIVRPRAPRDRVAQAAAVLERGDRLQALHEATLKLAEALRPDFVDVSTRCIERLKPAAGSPPLTDVPQFARAHLWPLYDHFDAYDMVLFPIRSGTDYGEGVEVGTIRISPEDAVRLVPELAADGSRVVSKLAGTRLGNFGGFLERRWRESDMMWGRLDAAERLIHALVPEPDTVAAEYVARAQAGIVRDTLRGMGVEQGRRMIIECAIRTENGKPRPQIISDLVDRLRCRIPEDDTHVLEVLSAPALLDLYDRTFREGRTGLERETIARLAARGTEITGRMLDAMSHRSALLGRRIPYLVTTAGRVLWTLVEMAAPRSLGRLVTTYWLGVIYLSELLMWLAGNLLGAPKVAALGGKLLVFTFAIDFARRVTGWWLAKSRLLRVVAFLLIALLAYLVVAGGDHAWHEVWPLARRGLESAWGRIVAAAHLAG